MFEQLRRLYPLIGAFILACCLGVQPVMASSTVQVAAAADLQPILPVILAAWEAQTGNTAVASFGSSATLATQIENSAPFDLFLSADMSFPEKLVRDGRATGTAPTPYARGTLVLWARQDARLPSLSMDLLKAPSVQSVAIANPEHAPYGRAAIAALTSLRLLEAVQPKLKQAENIAQAAQFAESGNAQTGLISLTSALTPRLQSEGHYIEVPASAYPPILQGAVVLKQAKDAKAAQDLLAFLLSAPIQRQLQARGLEPPGAPEAP